MYFFSLQIFSTNLFKHFIKMSSEILNLKMIICCNIYHKFIFLKIHLFLLEKHIYREERQMILSAGSLPHVPQKQQKLPGLGTESPGSSSSAFPGLRQGIKREVKQPGNDQEPIWDDEGCEWRISQLKHSNPLIYLLFNP